MIYIKGKDKVEPKTYFDKKELERKGYTLYVKPIPKPKAKKSKGGK